jgi:hypothetical protein
MVTGPLAASAVAQGVSNLSFSGERQAAASVGRRVPRARRRAVRKSIENGGERREYNAAYHIRLPVEKERES